MANTRELVELIARRVRRAAAQASNFESEIILELKHAQEKLEEGPTLPVFLKADATISPAANAGELLLANMNPANSVIRIQDDVPLAYNDTVSDELVEIPLESELKILRQKYPGEAEQAKLAVFAGDKFIIRPVPTTAYVYTVRHYKHDTAPTKDNSTLWTINFPDLIMNMAGYEVAYTLRDSEAMARFEKDQVIARTRFIRAVAAAEEAGQTHIMGDD